MIDKIEVSEVDENVFEFNQFEFVYYDGDSYILSEEGYFPIEGLQTFKKVDEYNYIVINEEGEKIIIKEEDFEKIKQIYLTFS